MNPTTHGSPGARAGTRAALVVLSLLAVLPARPASGQIEIRAAERQEELARIELEEVALRRHLVSHQQLAVWLPEGWGEIARGDGGLVTFASPDGRRLGLGRTEAEPGAGLIPILEGTLEGLQSSGLLRNVESVRRIRVAGRDGLEVAGSGVRDDGGDAARLVVSMDPDREHYRLILLQGAERPGEPLDAAYKRLIRDWTPLEHGTWTVSLERHRRALIAEEASPAWDELNRLFDVMSRPEAIGQAWIDDRLRALAREDPRLLLDGVFHHHPRVRIGCLESIESAAIDEPMRTALYAAAMADADPAVRFRVARRIAGDPGLAAAVLGRLLEADAEDSRAAAFQLLAAAPDPRRGELVVGAFSERRQYPEASQPLLAALLAEWGPRSEAEALLRAAWKRSRLEGLERATWLGLLEFGDPEAIAAARGRLERPLEASPLPLPAAATWIAVHAETGGDVEPWRNLAASLETVRESAPEGEIGEVEADLEAAHATLEELISYLETSAERSPEPSAVASAAPSPETTAGEDECEALRRLSDEGAWIAARQRARDCPTEPPIGVVRASVLRPGDYAVALLELLGRLEVGSALQNQAFHSLLEQLDQRIDAWAGDPITSASTGVDLEAPWEIQWWDATHRGGGTRGLSGRGGASLRLSSSDPERLLDTLVRASSGKINLEALAGGVSFSNALALVPIGLTALWSSEQETLTGADDASSTPAPTETYVALGADATAGDAEHRTLYRLAVGEEGPDWRLTHLFRRGAEVTLTHAAAPDLAAGDWRAPATEQPSLSSRIEVDLASAVEQFDADDLPEELAEAVARGLYFSAGTALGAEAIATTFRLDGLPPEWLSLAGNAVPQAPRAPEELLPESCLTWVGLRLDPSRLAAGLRDGSFELPESVRARTRRRVLEFADQVGGEAGLAILGVPDPRTEEPAEAWEDRTVVYLSVVDPAAADRFLRKALGRRESRSDRPFYRWDELFVTRVGRFLVLASDPEIVAALGRPPFFASNPMYRRIVARAPADALLWAGWDTDRLADALGESIRARDESEGSTFPVEIFRSFGGVVGWLGRSETALVGELTTHPRFQSEATEARVRRLAGYGDLARGSVRARGLPGEATAGVGQSRVEVTLQLPEDVPGIHLSWGNERLDQQPLEPGLYRFVSRASPPLPEESDLTLPITRPDLLPYARNEHNLDLHSEEIRELAETIRGEESDPARIVRAIVDWAHDGLEYTVIKESVSAERILTTRQADCTEFTQLTIALARSLGIPARGVQGVYVGSEAAYFHRWAEVHLDRWYEIDSTWGVVQAPATNLRIPFDDALFLATLPGARFTVQAVDGDDGGWARRLPAGAAPPGERGTDIAVDGDRVLVALPATPAPSERSPAPSRRLLYSDDGGRTFAEIVAPDRSGRPARMLGGHGRILWFADGEGSAPAAYELTAARQWRRLRLPPALGAADDWSVGLHPGGYLALAGASSRLVLLDRDLAPAGTLPLPEDGAGEWVVAREGGLVARAVEGEGITLHPWHDGGWAEPVEIADTADFVVVALRRAGDRIHVIGRQRPGEPLTRLIVGPESQSRRSVSREEAAAFAATATTADGEWTVWVDDRHQVLTRRLLGSTIPEEAAAEGPAEEPPQDTGR